MDVLYCHKIEHILFMNLNITMIQVYLLIIQLNLILIYKIDDIKWNKSLINELVAEATLNGLDLLLTKNKV
jgi:hypothetical protein